MLKKIFRRDVFTLISLFAFIWFLILEIGTPYAKNIPQQLIHFLMNKKQLLLVEAILIIKVNI